MSKKKTSTKRIEKKPFAMLDKYAGYILAVIALITYYPTINLGYTELDDKILIVENEKLNRDIGNIPHAFKRGVFSEDKDTYYRPILLTSFILNYQSSGIEIKGYHIWNIMLHIASVLLLFYLLNLLYSNRMKAFLLSLFFAVHPVLSQAVTWIPGRNDSLLFVAAIGFMIFAVKYVQSGKRSHLIGQFFTLLAALLTKETAVFVAPAAFVLLLTYTSFNWKSKSALLQYGTWALSGILWFLMRSNATIVNDNIASGGYLSNLIDRSPLLLQYFGKSLLPFNLSVFPMISDTGYILGLIAVLIMAVLLFLRKDRSFSRIFGGFGWFFLLIFPVLLLPPSLNNQDFEHRLYLPMLGILLLLGESAVFTLINEKQRLVFFAAVAVGFAYLNFEHQKNFESPLSFWKAAVETTPNSYYATMNLASRLDEEDLPRAQQLMRRAYNLDSTGKYVNYYIGKMLLDHDSAEFAKPYLEREIEGSKYYETYFYLSQLEFLDSNLDKSIEYMEVFLSKDRTNKPAMNNYVLMLLETGQAKKAKAFIESKRKEGISFAPALVEKVETSLESSIPQESVSADSSQTSTQE